MKAAVCHELGEPLVVEDVDLEAPRKRQVRVRLAAVSTCTCDLHILRGDRGGQAPVVAGHEAAGIVEEVGEDVTLAEPGHPVVVSAIRSCGQCLYCVRGLPHLCAESAANDASQLRTRDGTVLSRGAGTAAFAEQVVVDESQVARVPDEMPLGLSDGETLLEVGLCLIIFGLTTR